MRMTRRVARGSPNGESDDMRLSILQCAGGLWAPNGGRGRDSRAQLRSPAMTVQETRSTPDR